MKRVTNTTKSIVILCLVISLCGCQSGSSNNDYQYNEPLEEMTPEELYEQAQATLREQEASNPTKHLTMISEYWKNLVGNWVLKGTIYSNADVTAFKDVQIRLYFYSRTGTLLGEEDHIIYDFIGPQESIEFKVVSYGIRKTKEVDVKIISAIPLE